VPEPHSRLQLIKGVPVRNLDDTICAMSSAPGRAGIAVVRMSGPDSFRILGRIFAPARPSVEMPRRRAMLGRVLNPSTGETLDEALVTTFRSPHSYTGEDVAELSLHGSPVIVRAVLAGLCDEGARLAEPGEFTMRAFLRGKMDLVEAEAIRDIIEASTLFQAQVAVRQRSGQLSGELGKAREQLIEVIVELESALEFPEEDLGLEARSELVRKLGVLSARLGQWICSFSRGRVIRDGFALAIVGRPNVGKSSIFNALLEQERSIVTEVPGTTRDLVSEHCSIGGIPVRLLDTAGIRPSSDSIERLGVERSYGAMSDADAVLLVIDRSELRGSEDEALREHLTGLSYLVVFNKSDLPSRWSPALMSEYAGTKPQLEVSAKTGRGIEEVRRAVLDQLWGEVGPEREGVLITNLRHCRCLEVARTSIDRGAAALRQGVSEEYALVDLHGALMMLGQITGEAGIEEILDGIFSRFCIGK
jgi:tRNA modification GTPase